MVGEMPVLPLPFWVPPTISSPSRAACARSLWQAAVPPFPPVSCCLLPEYLQGRCLATCGLCLLLAIQPISVELLGARHWGTSVSKTRTLPTWNVNSGFVSPQAFLCIQLLASFRAPGALLPPLSRTYLVPLIGALTSRPLKVPENRVAVVQALGVGGHLLCLACIQLHPSPCPIGGFLGHAVANSLHLSNWVKLWFHFFLEPVSPGLVFIHLLVPACSFQASGVARMTAICLLPLAQMLLACLDWIRSTPDPRLPFQLPLFS